MLTLAEKHISDPRKMSPFARLLHDLRMRHGIRQGDLAKLLGHHQGYVSALEIGIKGPPPPEFVEKLISVLDLGADEQEELHEAVAASDRKMVIDAEAPTEVFWMLAALRERVPDLHPAQVRMIREIVELPDQLAKRTPEPITRLKRRRNTEARM